jgi:hypothetical protein
MYANYSGIIIYDCCVVYKLHNYAMETIILQHVHILTLRILLSSLRKIHISDYN